MKNIYLLLSATLFIASCGPTTVVHDNYQPAPPPPVELSYQSFYDQLSPYGTWVSYPGYGYVWMPNAGPDFRPYASNGNWVYTDAGWTWASNYSWGWAPFHYGRWFFENGYGWFWIPGNEWAPAWVSWRGNGDYYGWAPLGPRVTADMAMNGYNPPAYYWNFVPRQYIASPGWHNYYVNQNRNVMIINNTTVINNYNGVNRNYYAPGPDPVEVRRVSGNNLTPVQLREATAPGERISGNQYVLYRPRVSGNPTASNSNGGRTGAPAPVRYEPFHNVRPSAQYRVNESAPGDNTPANNARPQNTGYNQPNNNPQPAGSRPPNPVNTRPATNNQPVNQPVNNQPISDPRRVSPAPGNNQPNPTTPPANNTRPQNPSNNPSGTSVVPQNRNSETAGVSASTPASRNANRVRTEQVNQQQAANRVRTEQVNQPQPVNRPVPANTQARTAPSNTPQTMARPATPHNPENGQPAVRSTGAENKPVQNAEQKPAELPKTREADNK